MEISEDKKGFRELIQWQGIIWNGSNLGLNCMGNHCNVSMGLIIGWGEKGSFVKAWAKINWVGHQCKYLELELEANCE